MTRSLDLLVVTGMSGAGRSTAARALEDLGWFVIDNLPPSLLGQTLDTLNTAEIAHLAVVVDVRGGALFPNLEVELVAIRERGIDIRVLFLEANDESLIRRFESSRRPHPLQGAGRLMEALDRERGMLSELRASADVVIDTSALNVHDLRRKVDAAFRTDQTAPMQATLVSFGFKYGIPIDADLVLDMRFLPNPYWVPELRMLTGLDSAVSDYVLNQADADTFLDEAVGLIDTMLTGYEREGKRFVTIALGCTGGQHRSVAMSVDLARRLSKHGLPTSVVHRDVGRE